MGLMRAIAAGFWPSVLAAQSAAAQNDRPVLETNRHFLSDFDMVTIGIALIFVMFVLGLRKFFGRGR
jgi:hypothetical protein